MQLFAKLRKFAGPGVFLVRFFEVWVLVFHLVSATQLERSAKFTEKENINYNPFFTKCVEASIIRYRIMQQQSSFETFANYKRLISHDQHV